MPPAHAQILEAVREIPRGRVAAYGEVAMSAGLPRRARLVGRVLSDLDPDTDVPWHRVVNARGAISPRDPESCAEQRARLRSEGVEFNDAGRVDLRRFGW